MAFRYGWRGPNIVKDGLVLYLDASSPTSYNQLIGSTTWRDISGNNNNGTLTNGPTFSSANDGSIVFDGTDDYIIGPLNSAFNFCNSTNDLPFSISCWCYVNSLSTPFSLYNKGDNGDGLLESYACSINTSGSVGFTLYDTSGANQSSVVTANSLISPSRWLNITTTYLGTGGNTNMKIYVNAIQQNTTTTGAGSYTRMRQQNTNLFLGSFGSTGFYKNIRSNGRYSNFQVYNKTLSDLEILQNYNATKARFGL